MLNNNTPPRVGVRRGVVVSSDLVPVIMGLPRDISLHIWLPLPQIHRRRALVLHLITPEGNPQSISVPVKNWSMELS